MANFSRSDLEFILQQILLAEAHAAGASLLDLVPNTELPLGLRTVDGSYNHLVPGQTEFGAADNVFPRLLDPVFQDAQAGTTYEQTSGVVVDSEPRTISNLIVDQTANNPAAVAAAAEVGGTLVDGTRADGTPFQTFFIGNTAPDEGLSAPFNAWMTFFGQFFDHGLDLVTKGGSGTVFIPLTPDDPLLNPASPTNFMVLTRATNQPGPDGVLGTADDIHEHTNTTSPFVDQNQTYSSHPSHQVFLREYVLNAAGDPVATGKLIVNRNLGADGRFGTADDVVTGGMATWAVVKAQARDILGINLTDADVFSVPLLATDAYGNFLKGPNGFPQVVMVGPDGLPGTADDVLVEGNPAAPISLANAVKTGHAFLDDIAHTAAPSAGLTPDADTLAGGPVAAGTYDNELLDAHYIAGDGRVNENIGLTTVHHVFHSEHNRLVEQTKATVLQSGDVAFLNQWLLTPVAAVPADPSSLNWNGVRLFQAAKFGTEMQYQHLVFEEFARTIQPNVDLFLDFNDTINPAIVAEFAHTVYRFGHSMLTETIDRLDPNFASSEIGLIQAFLNPLEFSASGTTPEAAAGAIVRGVTRQVGNEIDEFVTEALRNNLLGLPLDLPAINLARARDAGIPSLNAARRTFYQGTGDSQLAPYTSWADFVQNLKHPESLVNFIAAYGTHASITGATTLADKRAAATLLVLGGAGAPADRLDFLNSTGAWASGPGGVTTTGLDDVDLWIGGLAEAKMPFGGMLGSTFNFVFETQLEALQNGDRLYYLHRTAGMHFLTELENNSFSKLVMNNTDVTHLPALMFSTPGLTLEVDQARQFNPSVANDPGPDGILFDNPLTLVDESADNVSTPGQDPLGENPLIPLVIRDNPATAGADTNYLQYTGDEHVVLGGTAGNDILISSIGDDTVYGDAGNDRLEGGHGNDDVQGGAGDDIITDVGGDDVLKGDEGNDVIHGGQGINLIIAGPGKDFIVTGEDFSETFAGEGDDFILGSRLDAFPNGNEGNDWFEIGNQDGSAGDMFDPLGRDQVLGHDVFLGDGGFDETLGEGGDDIAVGSQGPDKHKLASGFDWVTFKDDQLGVRADMFKDALNDAPLPASLAAVDTRFAQVEGLSGSSFADILRGDNADAAQIATAGFTGSALTNLDLISGLRAFVGNAAAGADGTAGTADDRFDAGNIILGGDGSDILEGRGGNDLIDGDRWLNVRVSVRQNADGTGAEIRSVDSIKDLVPDMLSGAINPGQLVIVREMLTAPGPDFDTASFSDVRANYTVTTLGGVTTVSHTPTVAGIPSDGTDRLTNIERIQFADQALVLSGVNAAPVGQVQVLNAANAPDNTPAVGQLLRASIAGVTDADNGGAGAIAGPVTYMWQFERIPGTGVFEDISTNLAPRGAPTAIGPSFTVTAGLQGLALRVKAHYQDANGVLETAFSAATAAVGPGTPPPPPAPLLTAEQPGVVSPGVHFLGSDLQFIMDQILIAERHAAGEDLLNLIPNARMALGLRTVDGSLNNLVQGQTEFGASDNVFPRMLPAAFRNEGDDAFDVNGPAAGGLLTNNNYALQGNVVDADPRIISNLIVDQTVNNPAAVAAAAEVGGTLVDGTRADGTPFQTFFIGNTAPDEGLSAPFNAWMTFFGQFFDHGLDLVTKGGSGTVFMPLQNDDPLVLGPDGVLGTPDDLPASQRFMVLTRATNLPGPDGVLGTADDIHEHMNTTSPFVDQNQTYSSHPAHQVFLRAYELNGAGDPVATGGLIVDRALGADGQYGTADDVVKGGMATWATVKAQARDMLGINLTDADVTNLPLLATDPYGRFLRGPNGFVQIVTTTGLVEGNPAANGGNGVNIPANVVRTGHAFLDDIAHIANPRSTTGALLAPDADTVAGADDGLAGTYDNELLDAHYIAGDGRVNENIGLTTVHHVFHSEHNRLVEHTKDVALATAANGDVSFLNQWLLTPVAAVPANLSSLNWNGERLFQAAKFGTEMQYQHLVFEEFARSIQPNIDIFIPGMQNYLTEINPAIVAEFAHTVYRFGHSMLNETVARLDPNFASSEIGLIQAFLNPLEFAASGPTPEAAAGAIVRGVTRQAGNEIDEFVTEALRNNLLGLPLDLPAINLARGRDAGIPSLNAARREFYAMTGDSQLAPYTSWADFVQGLKHPESLVNFVAAYGTHTSVAGATTVAAKRAAATLLVLGGAGAPADRLDFLNSTGAWASGANGVTTTGLDGVDLWIGGLAEAITPFGGMLGPTFNFVFETQLEALQNGDRFYYLERNAGLNFITELENNSFAKMVMNATDATHLPALIFQTNTILEVDPTKQFNTDLGTADPVGDNLLIPVVIRDNPETAGPDTNYLQYTGDAHVVLGGSPGNDILIASIGDDTLYGDAGNDRLEGGAGNDSLRGGPGDDLITDNGGDDNIQGDDGNDTIHAGNGLNLILGGYGKDFIVTGEDASEAFGGPGDDFILGSDNNEQDLGNEGSDWLEGGLLDGSPGDNFDPLGRDLIIGNDVFVGSGLADIMNAEGGDDIMVGSGGPGDKYLGASGFDWATFKDDPLGVSIDMDVRALAAGPIPAAAGILARFSAVEGLSGSHFSDILQGDHADALTIPTAGTQGSVLTNINLIDGLQEFLGAGVTSFGSGNIILGGDGSDLIEGRRGDDLLDGDQWLNVRISVRQNSDGTGAEIDSFDSLVPLVPFMVNGTYSAGQLQIVREILPGSGGFNFDTAVFSGPMANYALAFDDNGTLDPTDDTLILTDQVGTDGTDRLTHFERVQFADQAAVLVPGLNEEPVGLLTVSDTTPAVGQVLTASAAGITDADNTATGGAVPALSYVWQFEARPGTGIFEDILIVTGVGNETAKGPSFTVTPDVAGFALRVKGLYLDQHGVWETVFSDPTGPVTNPPVGTVLISDTTPTEGQPLIATNAFTDADGLVSAVFTHQWQASADGVTWTDIPGATAATFTPTQAQVLSQLRVVVSYTDDIGVPEQVISAPTGGVGDLVIGGAGNDTLTGTPFQDDLRGGAGNDTLLGLAENDILLGEGGNDLLDGGLGADTLNGGAGNDTFVVDNAADVVIEAAGAGTDTVQTTLNSFTLAANLENLAFTGAGNFTGTGNAAANAITGGAGNDTLTGLGGNDTLNGGAGNDTMVGGAGNDTYVADSAGDVVTEAAGAGTDTVQSTALSYTLGANVENLTFTGAGNFSGTGNGLNNAITGGAGNDTLSGLAGNDTLTGGAGDDTLDGGLGSDTMVGGAGNDTYVVNVATDVVTEAAGAGTDTVQTALGFFTLGANLENLTFTGAVGHIGNGNALANAITGNAGNDLLSGNDGNDVLVGAAGNDTLNGGNGADRLTGGAGNDTMNGGAGNDVLLFAPGFGADRVQGFDFDPTGGQDLLDISALGVTTATFGTALTIEAVGLADTLITIGGIGGSTITLVGIGNPAVVDATDFLLSA